MFGGIVVNERRNEWMHSSCRHILNIKLQIKISTVWIYVNLFTSTKENEAKLRKGFIYFLFFSCVTFSTQLNEKYRRIFFFVDCIWYCNTDERKKTIRWQRRNVRNKYIKFAINSIALMCVSFSLLFLSKFLVWLNFSTNKPRKYFAVTKTNFYFQ